MSIPRTKPKATASASAFVRDLEARLAPHADAGRAAAAQRYLKHDLAHLGVTVPVLRRELKAALRAHGAMERAAVAEVAEALWARPVLELRLAATEVLIEHADALTMDDVPLVERLLREARTWALVDALAEKAAGSLAERLPAMGRVLDRWARDDDFWIRRSALLALLGPMKRGGGDVARFTRYADAMLHEKEFFVRKAIGWILRETSKKRPQLVAEYLAARRGRLSGVTMREAVKYLTPKQRAAATAGP